MTRFSLLFVLGMFTAVLFLLAACDEEKKEQILYPATFTGTAGGCNVAQGDKDLRVGLMGRTAKDEILTEVASAPLEYTTSGPAFEMTATLEPPEDFVWILESDGETRRTELWFYLYQDKDDNGVYDASLDGDYLGFKSDPAIFFFDQDYAALNAKYGYNAKDISNGKYTQNFLGIQKPFIEDNSCL